MKIDETIKGLSGFEHETYPIATANDLKKTESALGIFLPNSYKTFVSTFSNGAYLFMLQEVNAVGDGNKQIMPIQSIETLSGDSEENIPFRDGGSTLFKHLIPFGLDSNGNAWCFISNEMNSAGEYPVAYFDTNGRKLYGRLDDFTSWLSILIEKQEEVIRTLYDENVLYDELQLG